MAETFAASSAAILLALLLVAHLAERSMPFLVLFVFKEIRHRPEVQARSRRERIQRVLFYPVAIIPAKTGANTLFGFPRSARLWQYQKTIVTAVEIAPLVGKSFAKLLLLGSPEVFHLHLIEKRLFAFCATSNSDALCRFHSHK